MTTLIPLVTEITVVDVLDRGIPNKERIAFKAHAAVDLGSYAVVLGSRVAATQNIIPVRDAMFWFGSGTVNANDWIILFTGPGDASRMPAFGDPSNIFILYWGRPQTILNDPQIVPVLWRISGIQIAQTDVKALPQFPG